MSIRISVQYTRKLRVHEESCTGVWNGRFHSHRFFPVDAESSPSLLMKESGSEDSVLYAQVSAGTNGSTR
jgi:hypothetical protein